MKRTWVLMGLICLFIIGCLASESPSAVVKKFYTAVEKNDMEALGKYASSDTVALMALYGSKMQGYITALGKVTPVSETIDGDTAVVIVTFENDPDEEEITLIKVGGKWKVHISMDK